MQYEILIESKGKVPSCNDKVRVHYTGVLTDGTVFDSSVTHGQPTEFPVTGVIAGWLEALQLMPVGSNSVNNHKLPYRHSECVIIH